ncbi:hypothetical protein D1872_351400 [compost metagenome]
MLKGMTAKSPLLTMVPTYLPKKVTTTDLFGCTTVILVQSTPATTNRITGIIA